MAEFKIPYGKSQLTLTLADSLNVQLLAPASVKPLGDPQRAVREALANPLGGVRLEDFKHARSVAIAINDKTRPVPHKILLPPLLEQLESLGVPPSAVTFVVATGLHGAMADEEMTGIVPDAILARYRVVSHDSSNEASLVELGKTRRGTLIQVNRIFVEADLRIVVGNVEPHQFMGFSGGVKTAAIGLAGPETINANHALMLDPRSDLARHDDNPARQEVEEIGKRIGVHFALNDVINEKKEIVRVFAGDPVAVMMAGMPVVREIYQAVVAEPMDLMIVSPGGHPKDINLYQAQKALGHAARVTREGGTIILVAACPDGTGSEAYESWVAGMESQAAVIERFRKEGYRIGPHKAFQLARDTVKRRFAMVTEMDEALMKKLLLTRAKSLDEAVAVALKELPPGGTIGILPWANATIPRLAGVE